MEVEEEEEEYEEIIEELEEDGDYLDIAVPAGRTISKDDLSRLTPDFESGDSMEEEIVVEEEVLEDSYEEVEVAMDEVVVEEEVLDDGSEPLPAEVMASFTGTPPDMGDFVFPPSDDEYVPRVPEKANTVSDEEMSDSKLKSTPMEGEVTEVSVEEFSEPEIEYIVEEEVEVLDESVEEIIEDIDEPDIAVAGDDTRGEEEEKREIEEEIGEADQIMNDVEKSEEESVVDFAPCLDVTDENEEVLTNRLYGALHDALDAWDLNQFDMVTPRPGQVSLEPDTSQKADPSLPSSSDLYWATQKAIDTIYPEIYCVPPLVNQNTLAEATRDNSESDNVKRQPDEEQQEESTRQPNEEKHEESISQLGEEENQEESNRQFEEEKQEESIKPYDDEKIAESIRQSENEKQEESIMEMETDDNLERLANPASNIPNPAMEDFPSVEKEDPAADTDAASTSASTNTEASGSSSSAALSSRPLFWAVEGSLEAIYPNDSRNVAPISLVENDEVDSQTMINTPLPANTEIFSLRLRQHQEERRRQEMTSSSRIPQEDHISVLHGEASKSRLDDKRPQPQKDRTGGTGDNQKDSLEEEEESIITAIAKQKHTSQYSDSSGRAKVDPPGKNGRKHPPEKPPAQKPLPENTPAQKPLAQKPLAENPPEVEAWDDEEAQFIRPTGKPAVVYNTDPTKYDRNEVVYERELIVVPIKHVENKGPGETARLVIRTLLAACLLVIPITTGAYLALRK